MPAWGPEFLGTFYMPPRILDSLFFAEVDAAVAQGKYELLKHLRELIRLPDDSVMMSRVYMYTQMANERLMQRLREPLAHFTVDKVGRDLRVSVVYSREYQILLEQDYVKNGIDQVTLGEPPRDLREQTNSFEPRRKVDL